MTVFAGVLGFSGAGTAGRKAATTLAGSVAIPAPISLKAVGIDGRLAVFGGDDDEGRFEQVSIFECLNHLPDRRIHELDRRLHFGCGVPAASQVSALDPSP